MKHHLEYTVRDVLETKCALQAPAQDYLVNFLKNHGIRQGEVRLHPAFSIKDCLVVILEGMRKKKRFFYHLKTGKIEE